MRVIPVEAWRAVGAAEALRCRPARTLLAPPS